MIFGAYFILRGCHRHIDFLQLLIRTGFVLTCLTLLTLELNFPHDRLFSRSTCFVHSIFSCVSGVYYKTEESGMEKNIEGQFYARPWNFEFFETKFCTMKLIPTESWSNGLFEITAIFWVLSMCLMWKCMKSGEFESHYIWNFCKEILRSFNI